MQREIPETMKNLYAACQTGKAGPMRAIRMQCYECMGYDREEVKVCTDDGCPLFAYRPGRKRYTGPRSDAQRKAAACLVLHNKTSKQARSWSEGSPGGVQERSSILGAFP